MVISSKVLMYFHLSYDRSIYIHVVCMFHHYALISTRVIVRYSYFNDARERNDNSNRH